MLTLARITGPSGESVDLTHGTRWNSRGYHLVQVGGLEPVSSDISYSESSLVDGGVYNSSTVGVRNLVFDIEYDLTYTKSVKELRRDLYKAIRPGSRVSVRLWDGDNAYLTISGYVEAMEGSIFTKTPSVQVSILSPSPHFTLYNQNYESPTLTPGTHNFEYLGDVETGFIVNVNIASTSVELIQIRSNNNGTLNYLSIPLSGMYGGLSLSINTTQGVKSATLFDSSGTRMRSVLGGSNVQNNWPHLSPGNNQIRVIDNNSGATFNWTMRYVHKVSGF